MGSGVLQYLLDDRFQISGIQNRVMDTAGAAKKRQPGTALAWHGAGGGDYQRLSFQNTT